MKRISLFLTFLIAFTWNLNKVQGQSIRSSVDTNSILIGNPIRLQIQVEVPEKTRIQMPSVHDSVFSGLEIVETGKIDTIRSNEKPGFTLKQTIVLTSFDSGRFFIPSFFILVNSDSTQPLYTEAIPVSVNFPKVVMEKEIKDIKPPIVPPFDWIFWIMIAGGLIVVVIVIWFSYQYYQKNKNPFTRIFQEKPLPPHELAIRKLIELKQKKLWQNGMEKQYHVELSEIVREYIEGRFKVNALEQVTDQTLLELRFLVSPELLAVLKQILSLSDLVKFAKLQAQQGENELSLNNAFEFVNQTKPIIQDQSMEKEGRND